MAISEKLNQQLVDGLAHIDATGGSTDIYDTQELLRERGIKTNPVAIIVAMDKINKGELDESEDSKGK